MRRDENGFSMVELLIVVALVAIVAAIAMMGSGTYKGRQLNAASRQLYGDLQKIRVDAMTKGDPTLPNSRGFGIIFTSNLAYRAFEFNDIDTDFSYAGTGEEINTTNVTLAGGIAVTLGNAGDPTANVLIFSKQGLAKDFNWSQGSRTYVIRLSGISDARCVDIANVTIREGVWNAASSSCAIQ